MKKAVLALLFILVLPMAAPAEEYAIVKDSLFGTQKIEFYTSREEALKHFTGEGRIYQITRTEVPVKRVGTRKKVEVTEYGWIVDEGKARKTK